MSRRRRIALGALGLMGVLLALLMIAVLVLTQTDFGRERVRRFTLAQLSGVVHGEVTVGRIRGNLLTGATLDTLAIVDSAGAPFLRADEVFVDYSILSLLTRRIHLSELRLQRPEIVLDRPPGGEWNFARIFPSDTTARDTTARGFGSWVRIENLRVADGALLLRNEWYPDSTLTNAARDSAVQFALSDEGRQRVVAVPGGYQSIQELQAIQAELPLLRLADPDSTDIVVEVASLETVAFPFRPPPVVVQNASARIVMSEDSLWFRDLRLQLPGSRVVAEGAFVTESGALRIGMRAAPLALGDLQFVYPALPDSGGGNFKLGMARRDGLTRVVARELDFAAEGAVLSGHLDVQMGEQLRLGETDLAFGGVDTRLMDRYAPQFEAPVEGSADGRIQLAGTAEALQVNGWVNFAERSGQISRLVADGGIGTREGAFLADDLRVRFDPVRLSLARTVQPDLAVGGTLTGQAVLNGSTATRFSVDADLRHQDVATGSSRVLAQGYVTTAEEPRVDDLVVRLAPLQLALVRAFSPDLAVQGVAAGRIALDGTLGELRVDADVTHDSGEMGRSRLLANGAVGLGETFSARALQLRLDPLQVALARAFSPELPVGGTLSGTATVTGTQGERFDARLDLTHRDSTGITRVEGLAGVGLVEPMSFVADLRIPAVAFGTVGRFAPAAGLRGSGSGALQAAGTLRDLRLDAELAVEEGGEVGVEGNLDLASERQRYDLRADFSAFDAAALTLHAPETSLTGTATAIGTGTDPASADAVIQAALTDLAVPSGGGEPTVVDAVDLLARVSDGLLTVERGLVQLASARAEVAGSFGFVPERSGALRYQIRVDSLSDFASFLPEPSDSLAEPSDSVSVSPDSLALMPVRLAGQLDAAGTVAGNTEQFDLDGEVRGEELVYDDHAVENLRANYRWTGVRHPEAALELEGDAANLMLADMTFDSLSVAADYRGTTEAGDGAAQLAIFQDSERDYRLAAGYQLSLERNRVQLDDLVLRFDTVTWRSTGPGVVSWGGDDIEVETLELRDGRGGRLFVDGTVPVEGEGDLQLTVEDLEIGPFVGIVQDSMNVQGVLSLDAAVQGSQRAPRLTGRASLIEAAIDDTQLPEVQTDFAYADAALQADATLTHAGNLLAVAEARLPVNLALAGYDGPRVLDAPMVVDVRMDSLALDALPKFTEAVDDVQGVVRGTLAVRGTFDEPEMDGTVTLDLGSLRLVEPGVRLQEIAGRLRIREDSVFLDSLVARSGGPIHLAGSLDIATPTAPAFDLTLTARNSQLLNNRMGRIQADADLTIAGPFDAVHVEGEVSVKEGVIYIPDANPDLIDLDDPALAAALADLREEGERIPEPNPLLDYLHLDVAVRIARNTWVRNNEANVEIYTPEEGGEPLTVAMDNRTRSLIVGGAIHVDRGEYEFSGRRLELTSGTITFLEQTELDPLLQLTATHEVPRPAGAPLVIQLNIGGRLSEPTLTLASNSEPPLPQSDLLSYLAFGEPSTSLLSPSSSLLAGGGGGGGGAGGLGAMASQQLAGLGLGALTAELVNDVEEAGDRAGLDVLRVSPADDLPEEVVFGGAFENILRGTEIEAGKYFSRRLFVSAQGRPSLETLPGMVVEYRTPSGLLWRTTWQPRYLPSAPSFDLNSTVEPTRVLGLFLLWNRRF